MRRATNSYATHMPSQCDSVGQGRSMAKPSNCGKALPSFNYQVWLERDKNTSVQLCIGVNLGIPHGPLRDMVKRFRDRRNHAAKSFTMPRDYSYEGNTLF